MRRKNYAIVTVHTRALMNDRRRSSLDDLLGNPAVVAFICFLGATFIVFLGVIVQLIT